MTDDELTPDEVAMYKPVVFRTYKRSGQWVFGPHIMYDGFRVYVGLWIGRRQIGFILQSFEGWRKSRLGLGPYRNA